MSEIMYQMYKGIKNAMNQTLQCDKACEHEHEPLYEGWKSTAHILEVANPDYRLRFESELGIRTEEEELAFSALKEQMNKLMSDFMGKYSKTDNPENFSPKTSYIMVDALTACLSEAQYQVTDYQPFTRKQIDHICYQIGDWYIHVKSLLEGQHNLGHKKELLKNLICGQESGR